MFIYIRVPQPVSGGPLVGHGQVGCKWAECHLLGQEVFISIFIILYSFVIQDGSLVAYLTWC